MKRVLGLLKIPLAIMGLITLFGLIVGATFLLVLSTLPSTKDIEGCFTSTMYNVYVCPKSNQYVRLSSIPSHMQWAVLLSEDAGFYVHNGLDWTELKASFEKNIEERSYVRGGSTITQQLVKNLYLSKDKTLLRKFREVLLALEVEKKLKKPKILELYFNVVEFGPDVYGIKKAASYYFGKHPSNLTVSEAVFLGTLLPNPKYFAQSKRTREMSKTHRSQMKVVAGRLLKTGRITQDQYSVVRQRVDSGFWQTSDADFAPTYEAPIEAEDGDFFGLFGSDESEEAAPTQEAPAPAPTPAPSDEAPVFEPEPIVEDQ